MTALEEPRRASVENDYRELKERTMRLGLHEPQAGYYVRMFTVTLLLLAGPYVALFFVDGYWWAAGLGVVAAFAAGQVALAAHDLSHRQTPKLSSIWLDIACGVGMLVLGMSRVWWVDKHNRHHAFPNQEGKDPDIMIDAIAFTKEQALQKRGFTRWIDRYQAFLFFPVLLVEAAHLRFESLRYLRKHEARMRKTEITLLLVSLALVVGLPVAGLGVGPGLVFVAVAQSLAGLYLGCVFAPNHKGMLVLGEDEQMDFFRRQVLTSRNVRPGPVTDYVYGALNYQIEHHLFPTMPRNRLGQARLVVQEFCAERGVPYHETSVVRSFGEIFESLNEASQPLRSH